MRLRSPPRACAPQRWPYRHITLARLASSRAKISVLSHMARSGNRCAQHEGESRQSPKVCFLRDSLLVYTLESVRPILVRRAIDRVPFGDEIMGAQMMRFALSLLFVVAVSVAQAQTPSTAQLIQDWTCPSGSCPTTCAGPGGTISINAHDVKVFQFTVHPRRLWLIADGVVFVLGDDDRCKFGGATSTPIMFVNPPGPPIPSVPLNPPPPQCTCIGSVCNPPGCGHN
jgi:hypothetical protein